MYAIGKLGRLLVISTKVSDKKSIVFTLRLFMYIVFEEKRKEVVQRILVPCRDTGAEGEYRGRELLWCPYPTPVTVLRTLVKWIPETYSG